MRIIKALMVAAIGVIIIILATIPAFAWYWPILGFSGPAPGSPDIGAPATVLPGTSEWALQPSSSAHPVPIGYPYGEINGSLTFGPAPSLSGNANAIVPGLGPGGKGSIG